MLEDIHTFEPDEVLNLGDTVWGGADPAGAGALQQEFLARTVRGNTDEFLLADVGELRPKTREYRAFVEGWLGGVPEALRTLPLTATAADGEVLVAHGRPDSAWHALFLTEENGKARQAEPEELLQRVQGWPKARVVVVGHTHLEMLASREGVTFVNAGPVSRQKDASPFTRWLSLERRGGAWTVGFRRVPYNWEAAARWAQEHAMNGESEARQLRTGRVE